MVTFDDMRQFRIFDVAVFDVVLTAIIAGALFPKQFMFAFSILVVLSVIVHVALGINTKLSTPILRSINS